MSSQNSRSSEIASELRKEILSGHFREGERLPSERDLSARFAASRGAVREALSQIDQLGLIDIQPGGARVRPLNEARIAVLGPLLAMQDVPDAKLLENFLQTFGALSALTAEEAISRGTDEQLNRLRQHVVTLQDLVDDFAGQQQVWRDFFACLSDVADNLVVQLIGNDLKAQFMEQALKLGIAPAIRKRVLVQIIRDLKRAIDKRDREKAGVALRIYFEELNISLQEVLAQMDTQYQQAVG